MLTRAALHVPADWVVAGRAGASTVLLLLTVLMGSTQAVPGVMELKAIVLVTPLVGEEVGVGLRDAGEDRGVGLREVGDDLLLEGAERFAEDTEGREIWGFFVLRSRRKSLKAMARAPTAAVAREAVSIGLAIIEVVAEDMSADVVSFLGANDFFNASTRCFSETFDFDA